jgi:hypothetical protein
MTHAVDTNEIKVIMKRQQVFVSILFIDVTALDTLAFHHLIFQTAISIANSTPGDPICANLKRLGSAIFWNGHIVRALDLWANFSLLSLKYREYKTFIHKIRK